MINIVIEILLSKKDKMPRKGIGFLIVSAVLFIGTLICLFFFLADVDKVVWGILSVILPIVQLVIFYVMEKCKINKATDKYTDYNKKLDEIRDILISLTYDNNGIHGNWYSKNKIRHLICECNKLLEEKSAPKSGILDFFKSMLLPVITFVAGVIADKASMEISLSLAVIAATFAFFMWGVNWIIKFLDDIILESSSADTIRSVSNMLKDLLERDFDSETDCEE